MNQKERIEAFLKELDELSDKYDLEIIQPYFMIQRRKTGLENLGDQFSVENIKSTNRNQDKTRHLFNGRESYEK